MPGKNLNDLIHRAGQLSGETDAQGKISANPKIFTFRQDGHLLAVRLIFEGDRTGVWIELAASTGGITRPDMMEKLWHIARLANADFIAFNTRRRGFLKVMTKYGFTHTPDEDYGGWYMRKELTPD